MSKYDTQPDFECQKTNTKSEKPKVKNEIQ